VEIQNKTYTLRNCRFLVDSEKIMENSNIVINNGLIESIGKEIEGDEIDCSKWIITPGFVNSHVHSAMIPLRGYYDDAELTEWLNKMWEFEKSMQRELMKLGSEISVLEMLSSGTTAFVDMYFNPDDIEKLTEKYEIKAAAGYTFLDSLFSPEEVEEKQYQLKKCKNFFPIVNVHSVYSVEEKTLIRAKELAEKTSTWIHIHVSETRKEIFDNKKKTGKFPVEYLHDLGLTRLVNAVHLGWIANWEIDYLKEAKGATHCPTSNMKLATAGAYPFYEMLTKGVNVTLGTDGAASNNSLDIIREMKTAVLLQRHSYWDTRVKALDVFKAVTENGYKLLGIKGGKIKEGYIADLAIFDSSSIYPLLKDRIISNIVYFATSEAIVGTINNGKITKKDYILDKKKKLVNKLNELLNKI